MKICIVTDEKPGHYNQTLGLAEALQKLSPETEVNTTPPLTVLGIIKLFFDSLLTNKTKTDTLYLGAGHKTHTSLLAYKLTSSNRTIVLMKPSIPLKWFDLCFIPEHDAPPKLNNVVTTFGAINRITPKKKTHNSGIILVGGPSKHVNWQEEILLNSIQHIIKSESGRNWIVATSRRTPDSTTQQLKGLTAEIIMPETQPSDWLRNNLGCMEVCWVTEDSVSMIYEALTAGCLVGSIPVKGSRDGKLGAGLNKLLAGGLISPYPAKSSLSDNKQCSFAINEAKRCAQVIYDKGWL